jgi:hypothetical protein
MSVVGTHAIPDDVLDGETERLLAMVDILEPVPPEELWSLARRSAFARLDARDAAVLVAPQTSTQGGCSCSAGGSGAGLTRKVTRGGS